MILSAGSEADLQQCTHASLLQNHEDTNRLPPHARFTFALCRKPAAALPLKASARIPCTFCKASISVARASLRSSYDESPLTQAFCRSLRYWSVASSSLSVFFLDFVNASILSDKRFFSWVF